jgi:hypothetical protein
MAVAQTKVPPAQDPEPTPIKALAADRLHFWEWRSAQPRLLIIPDGVSFEQFRHGAVQYMQNFGREILPQSLLAVVDESNCLFGLYFVRMATAGYSGQLSHVDLFPLHEIVTGVKIDESAPGPNDQYISGHSSLHGFHVKNMRTGGLKYQGLDSLDTARRMCDELMRNRPRT